MPRTEKGHTLRRFNPEFIRSNGKQRSRKEGIFSMIGEVNKAEFLIFTVCCILSQSNRQYVLLIQILYFEKSTAVFITLDILMYTG